MSNAKVFADDTCLFSIVDCSKASTLVLNSDLLKIQDQAYQQKMYFNPDRAKQAQLIFLRKSNKIVRPPLYLKNVIVKLHIHRSALVFSQIENYFSQYTNINLARQQKLQGFFMLQPILPRRSLLTIYKSLTKPHLDYGDVIMTNLGMRHFQTKLNQYNIPRQWQ